MTIRDSSCDAMAKVFSLIALGCGYGVDKGEFKLVRIIYVSENEQYTYDLEKIS